MRGVVEGFVGAFVMIMDDDGVLVMMVVIGDACVRVRGLV